MWSGFPGLSGNSSSWARPEDGSSWRVTKGLVSSVGRFPTQLLRGGLSLSVSSKGPFLLMWSGYQIQNFLCPWLSCLVSFTGMRCDCLSFNYHSLCVCICICAYVCVCMCACMHVYVYLSVCMHGYMHGCFHIVSAYACWCVCIMHFSLCVHTCMCICVFVSVLCVCVCLSVCECLCVFVSVFCVCLPMYTCV